MMNISIKSDSLYGLLTGSFPNCILITCPENNFRRNILMPCVGRPTNGDSVYSSWHHPEYYVMKRLPKHHYLLLKSTNSVMVVQFGLSGNRQKQPLKESRGKLSILCLSFLLPNITLFIIVLIKNEKIPRQVRCRIKVLCFFSHYLLHSHYTDCSLRFHLH